VILLAIFLFPIAVYGLILGLINRRPRPTLVPGSWDCAGLLFACAGVLLLGGPALIAALYSRDLRAFLAGSPRFSPVPITDLLAFYGWMWAIYLTAVIAGSGLLIWWRSRTLSVYNIEPEVFDDILALTLDGLGLEWIRMGDRILVSPRKKASYPDRGPADALRLVTSEHITAEPLVTSGPVLPGTGQLAQASSPEEEAVIDIQSFRATRHVTMVWRGPARMLRVEIEKALSRNLEEVRAPYNPAANWFLIAASGLFFLVFLAIAGVILIDLLARRAR
jgi:hypothetical protein